QQVMNDLVGIIRTEEELEQAIKEISRLKERARQLTVEGHRQYNPGWHLAIDLWHMLRVSECIALAARERKESRAGHTRDDYPKADQEWGKINIVLRDVDGKITVTQQPLPEMPGDLKELF